MVDLMISTKMIAKTSKHIELENLTIRRIKEGTKIFQKSRQL